ncbi:hypothetical protein ACIHEJ_25290 [Streptomyces sp. NPDC052301]|uniref:hypothetical protein n=1 Tax=Streptomyces sp. NPDC052301 TaxID=3365687 RepID=UPI0037D33148
MVYVLLVSDYGPEIDSYGGRSSLCRGPLVEPWPRDGICRDDRWRQWPALLEFSAVAGIVSVVAGSTAVYARLQSRLGRPGAGIARRLTFVTTGVISTARLAVCLPHMADCPSCSVEC